jgi:hypothetical protein
VRGSQGLGQRGAGFGAAVQRLRPQARGVRVDSEDDLRLAGRDGRGEPVAE